MHDYDFSVLSPYEFESLCRDLLQKKLNIFVEGFTPGKDGGIDLQFTEHGNIVIAQVKRHEKSDQLIAHLKKNEVAKVKALKPSRYIVCASCGLTPMQKAEIKQLFDPYILSTEDILGRNELNNLLSQHQDIEHNYYKLWFRPCWCSA